VEMEEEVKQLPVVTFYDPEEKEEKSQGPS